MLRTKKQVKLFSLLELIFISKFVSVSRAGCFGFVCREITNESVFVARIIVHF